MYKVFIDEKAFYALINMQIDLFIEDVKILENENVDQVFDLLATSKKKLVLNFFSNKECKSFFRQHFKLISAGGGLVTNAKNELLLIKRNGVWDLPKGKIEKVEKKKEASIREVEEECGISSPIITKNLIKTYHVYEFKGKRILKQCFWYEMKYDGNEKLIPQTEEGIEKVIWLNKDQVKEKFKNMYPSVRDVINKFLNQ